MTMNPPENPTTNEQLFAYSNFETLADEQQQQQQQKQSQEEEEEFYIHLKFDENSYPLRYDINDLKILGLLNGQLMIKIGDSYFMGKKDKRNQSTILFAYDSNHKFIQEIYKCRTKVLMQRIILRPKSVTHED